jgi:hypothetical protein
MNLCRQVSNFGEIVSFPLLFYSASNLLGATAHGMMVEQKQFSETVRDGSDLLRTIVGQEGVGVVQAW